MGKYDDLDRIQKLRDSGSITEEEFEKEKRKILNSENNSQNKQEGIYTASLVLGICSFLFGAIPIIGLILSIVALVISIKAKKRLKEKENNNGGVTAGLVLSIIGLLIAIFMTFIPLGTLIFNFSSSVVESSPSLEPSVMYPTSK